MTILTMPRGLGVSRVMVLPPTLSTTPARVNLQNVRELTLIKC